MGKIHHIFACKENIGDWLSARGIQSLIRPLTVEEHFCDEPFVADTAAALKETSDKDFIIIGGGGLFMDYFTPFWEAFRPISKRVPFCLWGIGYCDLKLTSSRAPRALLKEIIQRSRLCVVRDDMTRRILSECRIAPPVPCPSMAVLPRPDSGFGVLHSVHIDLIGPAVYENITAVTKEFAIRKKRPYIETNNIIDTESEQGLQSSLLPYKRADLIVSSRLHGCIIGLAMGRRVLAVSGDRKIESFMAAAGLEDWVCEASDIEKLAARLDRLSDQKLSQDFVEKSIRKNYVVGQRLYKILTAAEGLGGSAFCE
jgi:polysaccharide pyruvyl transferase WcaK-like protein